MGREIRRVPPNWEHPKDKGKYVPLLDESYANARREWIDAFDLWREGKHPEQIKYPNKSWVKDQDWWEYDSPPNRESYRPDFAEPPTWFQVYENVSEGTPVSPPFATKEELVEYLVEHGDFWSEGGFSRKAAEAFVKDEYAPSMIIADGKITVGIESAGR